MSAVMDGMMLANTLIEHQSGPAVIGHNIKFYDAAGLEAKEMVLKRGHKVDKHVHSYSHLSYLVSGVAVVVKNGRSETHTGPKGLTIEANTEHAIIAMTDIVWLCLHATAEAEKEIE